MINFYDEIFGVKEEWEDGISFQGKIILPNNNQVGVWFLTLCNKVYAYKVKLYAYKVKPVLNLLDWEVQLSRFWADFSSRSYIIKSTKVYFTCSFFEKLQLLIRHGNLLKFMSHFEKWKPVINLSYVHNSNLIYVRWNRMIPSNVWRKQDLKPVLSLLCCVKNIMSPNTFRPNSYVEVKLKSHRIKLKSEKFSKCESNAKLMQCMNPNKI